MRRVLALLVMSVALTGCWHLRITDEQEALCTERVTEGFFGDVKGCFVHLSQQRFGSNCYQKSGGAEIVKDCLWAIENPEKAKCKSESETKDGLERCLWEIDNPVEAKCEKMAAKHGGFWECMRLEKDIAAQGESIEVQRAAIQASERQAEADRDQRRREAMGRALQSAGDSFQRASQPPQRTKCVSRRTFGGAVETECE